MKNINFKDLLTRSSTTVVEEGAKKESIIEFVWEMVSCWLLTLGTSLLQNVQLPYPLENFTVVWQTALAVTLLALFSRRWFLMLIVTIQAILLGLLAMLLFQLPLGESIVSAADFCVWFFSGMPYDEAWSTGSGMAVLHTILNFGISILMFFVVRVSRGALPPFILCFSLLILIMTFGDSTNNAAAVALYLAGCLPMIARDRYNGRQLFSGEEKYRAMGTRWGVSTAAGVLCVVLAGTLLLAVPMDTDSLRVRWCADVTADMQSLTGWYTSAQRKNDTCTLDTLGLQAYPDRLGGNIELPDSEVLAVTDAPTSSLMRVTAFDTFTGENWKHDFSVAYRLGGIYGGKQSYLSYNSAADDKDWGSSVMSVSKLQTVNVTVKKDTYLLPTMAQVKSYTENTKTPNPTLINRNGELLSFYGYAEGYQYTLETLKFPTDTLTHMENAILDAARERGRDPFFDSKKKLAPYLEVPDTISDRAAKLAATLIDEEDSPLENARAIMNYFTVDNGFGYTLSPGAVRGGENIVDKVLTEKRGYCVYYSSAMAMMTRSVGIPTRLAAGYRTIKDASGQYVVDASTPFTWVECYFRNLGWVPFDPTPSQSTTTVPIVKPQINEQEVPEKTPSEDETIYDPEVRARNIMTVLIVLLAVALILWIVRSVFADRLYWLPLMRRVLRIDAVIAEVFYADILRQIGRLTTPHRAHQTVLEFLQQPALAARLGDETTAALSAAMRPMLAAHYGDAVPATEDVQALAAVHASIETVLKQTLRIDQYIWHRRVLRPWLTPTACRILYRERKNWYVKPSVTDKRK